MHSSLVRKNTVIVVAVGLLALSLSSLSTAAAESDPAPSQLRAWVQEMKQRPRGPFRRVRWFCNDGQVLPPEPYACSEFGGGFQYGEYTDKTKAIRAAGYPIANLLVRLRPEDIVNTESPAEGAELLKALILENFLISYDNGWIFRKAQFYSGATQLENEQYFGQQILQALVDDKDWLAKRWLVLREAVRLITHRSAFLSLNEIRDLATSLNERDPGFSEMRAKIHGRPDAGDAALVRDYVASNERPSLFDSSLKAQYETLATAIDQAYQLSAVADLLERTARTSTSGKLRSVLREIASSLDQESSALSHFEAASQALTVIRERLPQESDVVARVALLDASIDLERLAFVAGQQLLEKEQVTRREQIGWLQTALLALYGSGFISRPELDELRYSLQLLDQKSISLDQYREELNRVALLPAWAGQRLHMHFAAATNKFSRIEPKALQFVTDRLRGSLLLLFAELQNRLQLDANRVATIEHKLFGRTVGSGLRRLNPGLARGRLYTVASDGLLDDYDPAGIYVVPETLAELPPVAGLITRSEGNALSHVQLLARNLGIPNVVVAPQWLDELENYAGKNIVLAASPGGVVQLHEHSPQWDDVFSRKDADKPEQLQIDVAKLDLEQTHLFPVRSLRATHSGRVVGPKAAKLGELMWQFPGQVSAGLALPFGVYKQLLQLPKGNTGISMHNWLRLRYKALEQLKTGDPARYKQELKALLQQVRQWFLEVPLPKGFRALLKSAMQMEFGDEGSYGVFVRSDTNVEDLPNFSGAGLNLTVHHVVGFEETLQAIRRVWASPFSERAFAWRQSLMDQPEHVYASVLLHKSVPASVSGVMVTKDIQSDRRDRITVVSNEGVGGGVAGQLAETLHISLTEDSVRRLSTAMAEQRRVLLNQGGSKLVAAERPGQALLNRGEVAQLRQLALDIPKRIAEFAVEGDAANDAAVADVEFGFADGKLWLFQIRPLVENKRANRDQFLNGLDTETAATADFEIDLERPLLFRADDE
jgi:hypothetical protein